MSKKEIWLHGTSKNSAISILKSRKFKTENPINGANCGEGVYLTNKEEYAKEYGDTVIEVEVDMENILDLRYEKFFAYNEKINGACWKPLSAEQKKELTKKEGKMGNVQEKTPRDKIEKLCVYEQNILNIIGIRE
ncbi:hypothetical protein COF65_32215 [Bacillus toyonensis]|uniref:hypothetical protein n=1 Tax=Bacillus cereus group TaxID=86661 RepID=UPI000BF75610|nr:MULTISPECIES: hypothetical protein [Bacillus cereus group]PEQ70115.1 hypothetical protein CN474_18285 [Bacillus thuringiensis]PHD31544.1 hypothetical protein COF65_32215 [Bacillus toyonensis]